MISDNINEIMSRIEKLEKKNRNMRLFNFLLVLVIAGLGLIAFQAKPELPRIIEAEKFIVKDPEMGVLGYFGYSKHDDKKTETTVTEVALTMNGGVINISRGSQNVNMDASRLIYTDKSQPNHKIIELVNSSSPYLELATFRKDGRSDNVNLSPAKLFLYKKTPKNENLSGMIPAVTLGRGENINAGLNIFDTNGRLRAVIGSTIGKDSEGVNIASPESNIVLYDSTGKPIYKQPK